MIIQVFLKLRWTADCDSVSLGLVVVILFSHSFLSNCLWSHGLQHATLSCSSLSPGVCSNSCPLSQWCHPTFSSSVAPFSSCPQSFPESGSFPMSWLFESGSQIIGDSASASVLPMNIQGWFLLGLTGLISLQSKSLLRHHNSKASILRCSAFFTVQLCIIKSKRSYIGQLFQTVY